MVVVLHKNVKLIFIVYSIPVLLAFYNLVVLFFIGGKNFSDYFSSGTSRIAPLALFLTIVSFAIVLFSIVVWVKLSRLKLVRV